MAGYDPDEEIGLYEVCLSSHLIFLDFSLHFILVWSKHYIFV